MARKNNSEGIIIPQILERSSEYVERAFLCPTTFDGSAHRNMQTLWRSDACQLFIKFRLDRIVTFGQHTLDIAALRQPATPPDLEDVSLPCQSRRPRRMTAGFVLP